MSSTFSLSPKNEPFPTFVFLSFHGVFPLKDPRPTPTSAVGHHLLTAAMWTSSMWGIAPNFLISRSHPCPQTIRTSTNTQFSWPPCSGLLGTLPPPAHPQYCVSPAPGCAVGKSKLGDHRAHRREPQTQRSEILSLSFFGYLGLLQFTMLFVGWVLLSSIHSTNISKCLLPRDNWTGYTLFW